jgi:hypothetical protein
MQGETASVIPPLNEAPFRMFGKIGRFAIFKSREHETTVFVSRFYMDLGCKSSSVDLVFHCQYAMQ